MKTLDLSYTPIEWKDGKVRLLDQTLLPGAETYLETADYRVIATAIRELKVRGAPLIGVAGAYGVALGALEIKARTRNAFLSKLHEVCLVLAGTRPTARNLFWAIERMEKTAHRDATIAAIRQSLVAEALAINQQEAEATLKISRHGARLIKDGMRILTHCNTGPLATTGWGTAFGVILYAHRQGKKLHVYADETRPLLQGARLTAWELQKAGIDVTVIVDSAAGSMMRRGLVDCVIVGADRIAANGDTANKIGTYSLAVLAKENGIPLYVAAPTSTIDLRLKSGDLIPIEERQPEEVTRFAGVQVAPSAASAVGAVGGVGAVSTVSAVNPAFDVTPAKYITRIVTERGIIRRSYETHIFEQLEDTMELNPELVKRLEESLERYKRGERGIPIEEVARRYGIEWPPKKRARGK